MFFIAALLLKIIILVFYSRPLLLNADVLADVVKDEPVDIEEYSLVDKENNVSFLFSIDIKG